MQKKLPGERVPCADQSLQSGGGGVFSWLCFGQGYTSHHEHIQSCTIGQTYFYENGTLGQTNIENQYPWLDSFPSHSSLQTALLRTARLAAVLVRGYIHNPILYIYRYIYYIGICRFPKFCICNPFRVCGRDLCRAVQTFQSRVDKGKFETDWSKP